MAQWNPWQEMEALRQEIDRAFERVGGVQLPPLFRSAFLPGRAAREYPLINIYDDQNTLYLEALAPGADPASFNISVVRDTLTLSGEKPRAPGEVKPEAGAAEPAEAKPEDAAAKIVKLDSFRKK